MDLIGDNMKYIFMLLINLGIYSAEITSTGKIKDVVVYRNNQALITRVIELDLKEGNHEILVNKLPTGIEPNSIYAEATNADVRSARIKTEELLEENNEDIKKINSEMEQLQNEINKVNKLLSINSLNMNYLNKQEEFAVNTEKVELSKGILNSQTVKEITSFHFTERQRLALEELKLKEDLQKFSKQKDQLQRQRQQFNKSNLKNREAIIFLDKNQSGKTEIRLSYLINNSGWTPVYNFYAKESDKKIKVELNAIIAQVSGENWENVNLTLSNASKGQSSNPPVLSPFKVSLGSGVANYDFKNLSNSVAKKMDDAYKLQSQVSNSDQSLENNWELNKAAGEMQNLELMAKDEDLNVLKRESAQVFSTPTVNYSIKGKVNLPSKTDQQMVKVDRFDLTGQFYNVSIPLLTSYIYREAEIENSTSETLLAAQANAYLDEKFVGKAEISNVASGQSFIMGFGIDSQIRARRELVDKKEKILGGNKELNFNIRISLDNYSKKAISLRVLDRIPAEDQKENIRITLDLKNNSLSKDELYERYEKQKGILRWDTKLDVDSSGNKSKLIEYMYKLEFDKNLNVNLPSNTKTEEMKNEIMEIQKMRYNKR
jgi:uncharacterized protein (TIGR02231 family)